MDLVSLLKIVKRRLDKSSISYMVSGGIAVSFWGFPRTTHDINIVIEAEEKDKNKIIKLFEKDFYISDEAVEEAIKNRFTFNVIDNKSGLKIDFWLIKRDAFGKSEFSRKIRRKMFCENIYIISPEDLILCRLIGFEETKSDRLLQDAKSILQTSKVNMDYVKNWAEKQGTLEILNKLLK
ncbi:MAG: hypothetical protein A2812_00915 [Candidatus Staskawiczbacteria bacterium RIFCSPHIGHO2_01_FULL_36_16]|uniref:Nucleotidyl transferase AbiEii/AbiGii toxin family protein n=1 Tax=Candidatus Staskawiczbacteria bacterium RIFCSPHIGHO2_01_FULL_36_16 TaxID=1802200 RepID=A0A1G2HK27_9BACT|nr:MAG: hypothetical protein A2812_00915 [Candidatus Staskawiczbacteria bacterium RIFCSPHIGHO2_01_FULL_36_16]